MADMKRFTEQKLHFPNIWSKWLLQDSWDRQFHIPVPNPPALTWALRFLEDAVLRPDVSQVRIEKPIFLIGPPRSGTTMLQDLMACHERIAYLMHIQNSFDESVYAAAWIQKALNLNVRGERYLQDSIQGAITMATEPSMLWGKWMERRYDELEWPPRDEAFLTPAKRAQIEATLKKIILWFSRFRRDPRFMSKYPAFATEIPTLRLLFPDARFIHIIRDGRQVANSMVKLYTLTAQQLIRARHPVVTQLIPYPRVQRLRQYIETFGPESLETTARVWSDCLDLVAAEKQGKTDIFDVRYEDILADPIRHMGRIWEFCGLEPPISDNVEYRRRFEEIGRIKHANTYRGFDLIEKIVPENLRRYGYL